MKNRRNFHNSQSSKLKCVSCIRIVAIFVKVQIPVNGGRFVCQTLVQIMIDWAWMKHKNEMIDQNFRIGEINYLRLLLLSHFRLLQNHVSYYL